MSLHHGLHTVLQPIPCRTGRHAQVPCSVGYYVARCRQDTVPDAAMCHAGCHAAREGRRAKKLMSRKWEGSSQAAAK
jgi:hypothetical protein